MIEIDSGDVLRYFFISQFSISVLAIYAIRMDLAIKVCPSFYEYNDEAILKNSFKRLKLLEAVNRNFHFNRFCLFVGSSAFLSILVVSTIMVEHFDNPDIDGAIRLSLQSRELMVMIVVLSTQVFLLLLALVLYFALPLLCDIGFSPFAPKLTVCLKQDQNDDTPDSKD